MDGGAGAGDKITGAIEEQPGGKGASNGSQCILMDCTLCTLSHSPIALLLGVLYALSCIKESGWQKGQPAVMDPDGWIGAISYGLKSGIYGKNFFFPSGWV